MLERMIVKHWIALTVGFTLLGVLIRVRYNTQGHFAIGGVPELLTLDFSGVTFMDSSGVGLILGRGRHISALGGRLTVQNPPPAVRRMLDLARITYA